MCCLCLQVVGVLKKEVMKTQSKEVEKGPEYRQLLVQAIHSWYILHPTSISTSTPIPTLPYLDSTIACDVASDPNMGGATFRR